MSSSVCRFFLNGNCRFGDRCRYSHNVSDSSFNSNYSSSNPYVLNRNQPHDRQSYNEPKQNWRLNLSYNDIQEIIEKIRDEAKQVEYEKLWPLTCLNVLRDAANVPGWDDYSMEELRVAAYSAKISGCFDEYVQLYQTLLQKAKDSRAIFLRPGKRAEELVRSMFEQQAQDSKPSSHFSFAQIPAFSQFSSTPSTMSGSVFGGSQTPGAAFGSMAFGSGASSSTPGIFARAAQPFASNTSQGSVLSDSDMETASESLLNQTPSVSPFHQNNFGQATPKNPFASQGTSTFAGSSTPNVFGSAPDGKTASSNVFGGAPEAKTATSSVFGSSSNTFGGTPASNPFNSGSNEFDDSLFTPMNELSESDLEQFKAPTFTLSKLPLVPPPKELC